jgi:hypothetical protein
MTADANATLRRRAWPGYWQQHSPLVKVGVVHWSPTCQVPAPTHVESANDSPPALPFGPHAATHDAPSCWQMSAHVRRVGSTCVQPLRNGPALRQEPWLHTSVPVHFAQLAPPTPQALVVVPARQLLPLQQPVHDVVSQTQAPPEHVCPVPHAPVVQVPPQPSLPPHATPAQLGVQPVQRPPAQDEPFPVHCTHTAPPRPHALVDPPGRHCAPLQQPLHEVGSHTHAPPSQCSPAPQLPVTQTPPQPSLAPHALVVHEGVHVPVPQRFAPPPPQVRPEGHAPQSRTSPQRPDNLPQ